MTSSPAVRGQHTSLSPARPSSPPKLRPHPHLYQINTWVWLEELSASAGRRITLGDVPDDEWDRLAALGFDLIYLMGVWRRSAAGRRHARWSTSLYPEYDRACPGWRMADVVGSAYSIQEYVPDPRMGTWEDLDGVRTKLHARGMGLVVDFVPNHTGPDHAWAIAHPEYYIQPAWEQFRFNPQAFTVVETERGPQPLAQGRDPNFLPWSDTLQLNYFNPAVREAMRETLALIARHADGVRCDMAMLELNDVFAGTWHSMLSDWPRPREEFWPQAIASAPGLLFIAEVYWDLGYRLQQLGFHYTYDKEFYDRLRDAPPQDLRAHLTAPFQYQSRLARFLENHDEPRAVTVFPAARLRAAAIMLATLPGMRFYHQGQLEGRSVRLPVQLGRTGEGPVNGELQQFYSRLLQLTDQDIFHSAEWKLLEVSGPSDLLAWRWKLDNDLRLVVVNLSSGVREGLVRLDDKVDDVPDLTLADELRPQPAEVRSGQIYVRLEGFGAHLFRSVNAAAAVAD